MPRPKTKPSPPLSRTTRRPGTRVLDEQVVDPLLRGEGAARQLGDVHHQRVRRGAQASASVGREMVDEQDVGLLDRSAAGDGHQAGVTGSTADQGDGAGKQGSERAHQATRPVTTSTRPVALTRAIGTCSARRCAARVRASPNRSGPSSQSMTTLGTPSAATWSAARRERSHRVGTGGGATVGHDHQQRTQPGVPEPLTAYDGACGEQSLGERGAATGGQVVEQGGGHLDRAGGREAQLGAGAAEADHRRPCRGGGRRR